MKYPNLLAAMAAKGNKQYETARAVGMSESAFSRCLRGLKDFSRDERARIATFLGYSERWLFKEVKPPRRAAYGERKNSPSRELQRAEESWRA